MTDTNNSKEFEFTYSTSQQEKIERIRKKYLPKQESKMEQLIKLDKQAENPGQIIFITIGVLGCLLLGIGMSCTMVGNVEIGVFAMGIAVGVIGLILAGVAYPIKQKVTEKERAKIADQIIALTDELSFENE